MNDDLLLVTRFKKGDENAFNELVNRYKEKIYYLAYKMIDDHAASLDISQKAFIKAHHSIQWFWGKSSFYSWIYRITINLCLNHFKKESRRREVPLDEHIAVKEPLDWQRHPDKAMENKELQENLSKAIDSLPPRQKAVFVLHHQEGLTHKKIASLLGCTIGNVKANHFQAIKKLREMLKDYISE